jgi:D-alanine-D-alanine ligase-like ATP-grasp enzyme
MMKIMNMNQIILKDSKDLLEAQKVECRRNQVVLVEQLIRKAKVEVAQIKSHPENEMISYINNFLIDKNFMLYF